jgi:hypothetical protein
VLKFGKKIQKLISYFGKEKEKKKLLNLNTVSYYFSFDEFCNWGKNEGPQ